MENDSGSLHNGHPASSSTTKAGRVSWGLTRPPRPLLSLNSRLARRIEPAEARGLPASRRAIPTEALLVSEGRLERSELFWRISVPILALVLTLVAIPLGQVNPRMGRSFNLLAAAFLYMVYSNGLNIVQSLIAQGKVDFWVGLLVPHALAIALVALLFGIRLGVIPKWGARQAGAAAA